MRKGPAFVFLDPIQRLVDLTNFGDVPFAQAVEQIDSAIKGCSVEPVGVLLHLPLLFSEMLQRRRHLLPALG